MQLGKDVVWVGNPEAMVQKMLDVAGVTPQDYVIDLGSGDGRNVIAAAKRGARAHGIEYNGDLVELSRSLAAKERVSDRATFERGDVFEADISKASVVVLFLTPEMKASLIAPFHTEGFDDAFIKFSRDMRHLKLHGRTHRVQCPTLIVWGEHDLVVPPADGRYFVDQIQNSRLVILPKAGHLPHDEQAETVNGLIREFTASLQTA